MQRIINWSILIISAVVMCGCGSTMAPKHPASAATQTNAMPNGKSFVMQSAGTNVLKLTAPADIKCVAGEGSLHFTTAQYEVEFWLVRGATTVGEATSRVSTQIVDEFKDFKPERTLDLTVAGSPAKQLIGAGHEADDGDPGDADVIVFKVGDKIFIACNHGESLTGSGQQGLMTLVQTAETP